MLFAKWATALIGPDEPIVLPSITSSVDFEGELGVVIGERVKRVSKENALEVVRGYICVNDVSARDLQQADKQYTRANDREGDGQGAEGCLVHARVDDRGPGERRGRCRDRGPDGLSGDVVRTARRRLVEHAAAGGVSDPVRATEPVRQQSCELAVQPRLGIADAASHGAAPARDGLDGDGRGGQRRHERVHLSRDRERDGAGVSDAGPRGEDPVR
jgi:hypothetical protein